MSTEDIIKRAEPFLNQCGSCDAGLLMSCTCPQEDYRPVMLELVREVERLRKHPSGWQSRFFRIEARPGSGLEQVYRNSVTGEFRAMPYDHADREPFSDWEPVYVYRSAPE